MTVVRARLSRLVPEQSLLLAKATATVPHGGGRRLTGRLARIPDVAGLGPRRCPGTVAARSHGPVVQVAVEPAAVPSPSPVRGSSA